MAELPDIEDAASSIYTHTRSPYFSPLQTRKQRKIAHIKMAELPDIEDAVSSIYNTRSPYFSPLQTRQQRKIKHFSLLKNAAQSATEKIKQTKKPVTKEPEKFVLTKVNTTSGDAVKSVKYVATKATATSSGAVKSQWEPEHWKNILENIRTMRASNAAPVDLMGCDKCADECADEKTRRFQKLVALMLSSQTKDTTTFEAMQRLKSHILIPNSIVEMKTTQLENLLNPVSFHKNKAKYLQQTSRILIDKYNSDIPNNIKELMALPGVGPKMAHICMAVAWNEVTGIGVDVHVHRIVNRLRWIQHETKDPEKTRVALENWLPRVLWKEVNHLLVGFGQVICTPLRPRCGECLNRNICPSANKSEKALKGEKSMLKKT